MAIFLNRYLLYTTKILNIKKGTTTNVNEMFLHTTSPLTTCRGIEVHLFLIIEDLKRIIGGHLPTLL